MVTDDAGPLEGRKVAVLVGDATPARSVSAWRGAADALGVEIVVVGPHLGKLEKGAVVDKTIHTTQAVEYDGVVLAAAPDEAMATFVQEAYRHHKTVAFLDESDADSIGVDPSSAGVEAKPDAFFDALALHRHWDR